METTSTPISVIRKSLFMWLFVIGGLNLSATVHTIGVQNFSFSPNSVNANVGDTIIWQWISGTHTTTSSTIPAGAAAWNASMTSATASFLYVLTVPGTYNYLCTIHNFTGVITVGGATGIEKIEATPPVLVYPSPFINQLTVDLNFSSVFKSNVVVELYDLLGTRKYRHVLGDEVVEPLNVDVSGLPQGIYFVSVSNGKDKATFKVTKL